MGTESTTEIISLLKDVQKQLNYLEKKIDALSRQSGGRTSPGKNYTSPSRYTEKNSSPFAGFKKTRTSRPGGNKRSTPGSTYPKKNQEFRPKKDKK